MLQRFAEYVMLKSYLLSGGGDRLVNLEPWSVSQFGILGVSSVVGMLGAGSRRQAIAALF